MLYTIVYNMVIKMADMKKRVIELLKKHPEGLTTVEMAKMLNTNRHTLTKYIYELVGAKTIHQRKVGPAKLCYLKKVRS